MENKRKSKITPLTQFKIELKKCAMTWGNIHYFILIHFKLWSLPQIMFMLYKFEQRSVCLWRLIRPESRSDSEIKHHATIIEESKVYLMSSVLHYGVLPLLSCKYNISGLYLFAWEISLKSYKCLHFQPKMNFSHIHIHTGTHNLYFPSSSIISPALCKYTLCKYFDDPSLLAVAPYRR